MSHKPITYFGYWKSLLKEARPIEPGYAITTDIENILLDVMTAHTDEPFHFTELLEIVKRKVKAEYASMNLKMHVSMALDKLHANRMIKHVAPNTWESEDGPDPADAERKTGYAPEGEYAHRGRNFLGDESIRLTYKQGMSRPVYNAMYRFVDWSVRAFQKEGRKTPEEIVKILDESPSYKGKVFARVAIRLAVKNNFNIPFSI